MGAYITCRGYVTPATYMYDGKQYIMIAASGGGKVETSSAATYVAFCLRDEQSMYSGF
ncbi:MAG: hypothetical protein QM768_16825 [Agriterribacter sp.]